MRQFSYLAMLVCVLAATVPLERVVGARVLRRPRRLALTLLIAAAPFVCWDLYSASRGHWSFDPAQTVGFEVPGALPLEELGFFVVIPLAVVFTLEAVRAVRGRIAAR